MSIDRRFNITLEKCPFCKSYEIELRNGFVPQMICRSCGAEGPNGDTIGEFADPRYKQLMAVRKWNDR